eukprot:123237-Rhodomonas_salina.1
MGAVRDVVKKWVLGEPGSRVSLVFEDPKNRSKICVMLRREVEVERSQTWDEGRGMRPWEERHAREETREERVGRIWEEGGEGRREDSEVVERGKDSRGWRGGEDARQRKRELEGGRGGSEHGCWEEAGRRELYGREEKRDAVRGGRGREGSRERCSGSRDGRWGERQHAERRDTSEERRGRWGREDSREDSREKPRGGRERDCLLYTSDAADDM